MLSSLDSSSVVKVRPLQVALQVIPDGDNNSSNNIISINSSNNNNLDLSISTATCSDTLPLLGPWSSSHSAEAIATARKCERKAHDSSVAATHATLAARLAQSWRRTQALRYIVLSALHFSAMSVCVKFASRRVTSHETAFWRTTVAWVLNFAMLRYNRVNLRVEPKHWRALLLRSVVGTLAINIKFYAMSHMVLTDAVMIISTSPVQTFILGALLLGETAHRADFAGGVLSYCGVLFVTRPAFLFPADVQAKTATTLAVLCAHGGAFMQACCYICMRQLRDVNFMVTIHYFLLFGIGFSVLTMLVLGVPLQLRLPGDTMLALVGSGVFAFLGHIFLTKGFQREKAGVASVMRYFDVVFVLLWDTTILGEHVSGYSILGGAIILLGAGMIVLRRAHAAK